MNKLDNTQKIKSLYVKLYDGDEVFKALPPSALNQAILILGLTGAGKSTLTQLITRAQLRVIKLKGRHIIDNEDPSAKVKIGQTIHSCTEIPNYVVLEEQQRVFNIYDCPGFLDTNRFDAIISNSYYVYQLFSKIAKIKFILAIDESGLFGPKAAGFIQSVNLFLKLFKFTKTFTVEDLSENVLIVFTKSNNPIQNILDQIAQIVEDYEDDDGDSQTPLASKDLKRFLLQINNQNRIELVKAARLGERLPDCSNIINKLQNVKDYIREVSQGDNKIDMTNINFRIGSNELEGQQLDTAKKAFESCNQAIQDIFKLILGAIEEIRDKLKDKQDTFDFFNSWNQAIPKYRIRDGKWQFKSQPTKKYLHKLHLLNHIYKIITSFFENEEILSIEQIKTIVLNLLERFAEFLKLREKDLDILKEFTFILNRKFEEIAVLQQIGQGFLTNNRQFLDILKGFLISTYDDNEQNFIIYSEVKQGQYKEYYSELIQYLKKYEDKEGISSKIATALELKANAKNYKYSLQAVSAKLKNYLEARSQTQKANRSLNQQYYVKVNVELYKIIANILLSSKLYDYAIKFFKVIDYTDKIIECYDILIKNTQNQDKVIQLMIQQADYLRSVIQSSRAVQIYKKAMDLTYDQTLKKKISKKLAQVYLKREEYYQKYEERVQRKQYFNRLDENLTDEQLLEKIGQVTQQKYEEDFDLRLTKGTFAKIQR